MTPLRIQISIDFSDGLHSSPPLKTKQNKTHTHKQKTPHWQSVWVDLALKFAVERKSLNILRTYYQFIVSVDW